MATRQANVMRWLFIVVLVVLLQLLVAYRQEDELEQLMALVDEENTSQDLSQGDQLQKSVAQIFVALHDVESVSHGVRGPCTLEPFYDMTQGDSASLSRLQPCYDNNAKLPNAPEVQPEQTCEVNCNRGFSQRVGKGVITCGAGGAWDFDVECIPCVEQTGSCPIDGKNAKCVEIKGACQPKNGDHVHDPGNSCKLTFGNTYPKALSEEKPCSNDHSKTVNIEGSSAPYILVPDGSECHPNCQGKFKPKDPMNPPVCIHATFTPPIECIPK